MIAGVAGMRFEREHASVVIREHGNEWGDSSTSPGMTDGICYSWRSVAESSVLMFWNTLANLCTPKSCCEYGRASLALLLREEPLSCKTHESGCRVDVEFDLDVGPVGFHGAYTESKALCNLPGPHSSA